MFFYYSHHLKKTHLTNDLRPIKYSNYSKKIKAMLVNFLVTHFVLPQDTNTCSKVLNVIHLFFLLIYRLLNS